MERFRTALKTDCEQILGRFQATDSVRYEEFSSLWREMGFSSMFYGRSEHSERRVFARLALSVVSPYLSPPYTFQIRVGGLYLLYGFYYTQLTTPKEKIRLALKDWDDLMRFHQDAVNAQHYDVVYILRKLLLDKAFYFTAMPDPLFFNLKRKQVRKNQQLCDAFVERPSRPQELISTDMLEELANVHEHYEKLKQAVSPQPAQSGLNLIKHNLAPKLRASVVTYHSWQQNRAGFESQSAESDMGAGEGTSGQEEASQRARLLESIKSRSYGQAVEASRSRRHRQVEMASADVRELSNYRRKALSLKERTEQRFGRPGNLRKELKGMTRLWCLTTLDEETKSEEKDKAVQVGVGNRGWRALNRPDPPQGYYRPSRAQLPFGVKGFRHVCPHVGHEMSTLWSWRSSRVMKVVVLWKGDTLMRSSFYMYS
ncbi:hypothetical protein NFI96_018996 [Prochilodus magdalenae]|nr:hypothetical protein NFI96_018996 [Prochilodus magdalenae]